MEDEYLISMGDADDGKQGFFLNLSDKSGETIHTVTLRGFSVYTRTLCFGVVGRENAINLFDRLCESMAMFGGILP